MCWPALCPSQPGTSRKRLLARGVSGLVSITSPMRQTSFRRGVRVSAMLVPPVALFAPRVAVVVVTQGLPEAGFVFSNQPQSSHPLGALPEVKVRHEQAGRTAVLRLERLVVVGVGDPGLTTRDGLQREVRGVAAVAKGRDVLGRSLHPFQQGI